MRATAITEAQRQQYLRTFGESWFCCYFSPGMPELECGLAEISLSLADRQLTLCRTCATDIADQLRDAVGMVDAADVARTLGE